MARRSAALCDKVSADQLLQFQLELAQHEIELPGLRTGFLIVTHRRAAERQTERHAASDHRDLQLAERQIKGLDILSGNGDIKGLDAPGMDKGAIAGTTLQL
ncbi:hypothetical protein [Granulosicoccus antarcticus]|uniref:hypothetical protein n=1 Tax=Granulosicoccus antarcticus TaxID=437505 RepID=UPI0012FD84CE|nr:hypothetical protein [Granulosicoccus antarcticus]